MGELKTKQNKSSVKKYINSIKDEVKRKDSLVLLKIFESVTKEKGVMWGDSIIGFGKYHYKSSRSSQEGDWPLTSFSPRVANLTIYIMPGFKEHRNLLKKLGPHKTSVSCLYIKRLSDINVSIIKTLIKRSVSYMRKKYKVNS